MVEDHHSNDDTDVAPLMTVVVVVCRVDVRLIVDVGLTGQGADSVTGHTLCTRSSVTGPGMYDEQLKLRE